MYIVKIIIKININVSKLFTCVVILADYHCNVMFVIFVKKKKKNPVLKRVFYSDVRNKQIQYEIMKSNDLKGSLFAVLILQFISVIINPAGKFSVMMLFYAR